MMFMPRNDIRGGKERKPPDAENQMDKCRRCEVPLPGQPLVQPGLIDIVKLESGIANIA